MRNLPLNLHLGTGLVLMSLVMANTSPRQTEDSAGVLRVTPIHVTALDDKLILVLTGPHGEIVVILFRPRMAGLIVARATHGSPAIAETSVQIHRHCDHSRQQYHGQHAEISQSHNRIAKCHELTPLSFCP